MPQKKRNDFAVAVGLLGLGFTGMLVVSMIGVQPDDHGGNVDNG